MTKRQMVFEHVSTVRHRRSAEYGVSTKKRLKWYNMKCFVINVFYRCVKNRLPAEYMYIAVIMFCVVMIVTERKRL